VCSVFSTTNFLTQTYFLCTLVQLSASTTKLFRFSLVFLAQGKQHFQQMKEHFSLVTMSTGFQTKVFSTLKVVVTQRLTNFLKKQSQAFGALQIALGHFLKTLFSIQRQLKLTSSINH